MVSYSSLTDPNAVDEAIAEFDRIGRFAFLEKYGFGEATEYFLVTDDGLYDSKAIFGVAYGNQHGTPLGNDEFTGGKTGAAARLAQLGYSIEGLDPDARRQTFESLEAALNEFRVPVENLTMVREFVSGRDVGEFYIPPRKSYIALVPPGETSPNAWIHVGYIHIRNADRTIDRISLPYNGGRRGGAGRRRQREEATTLCPTPGCGMVLPPSGVCDYC
ncbi:hypothetical protein [Microbacterium bovistercoris]|uniref:hypothetical protein n=1 Tax=Microbacterium bovistercoris TaxID=2293570 RepID=UPI0015F2818A|nr:hypothetical protein [Microbacterium bovistercoris]